MNKPLISIVGPTATGKSDLAVFLAKNLNGEIISADSRQVYKGLDIGSGKITKEEMSDIPHHLIDIEDVNNEYTVSHFKKDALAAIEDILSRNRIPIICGGTGFWVDTVTRGLEIPEVPQNKDLRDKLSKLNNEILYKMLVGKDPIRAQDIDKHNPYRLIRALEIIEALGKVPEKTYKNPPYNLCTIGITSTKEELENRISKRLDARFDIGMIDEIKRILDSGVLPSRLISLGLEYRHITQYIIGEYKTFEEMREKLYFDIVHFSKRQMTWFKRHKDISWIDVGEKVKALEIIKNHYKGNTQI